MVESILKDLLSAPKELLGSLIEPLDTDRRAAVVARLQEGWTRSVHEDLVVHLFRATRGESLARLKDLLDGGRGHRDLHQLVFHDVDDDERRAAILAHFAEEARALPRRLHILSDIDDTVICNWKDVRYPKKTLYPGVVAFYEELSGPSSPAKLSLTFLSARPGDRTGIVERKTLESLEKLGLIGATMLAGALSSALGNARIAAKKLDNFLEYASVYPERDFVFVGDSGQGDVVFGEAMLERSTSAHTVFIHDVVSTPEGRRDDLRKKNVHLFDSYVGAAAIARQRGLLSAAAARRVRDAVFHDIERIAWSSPADREARLVEIARDEAALGALEEIAR
jgi:hypothetical protein